MLKLHRALDKGFIIIFFFYASLTPREGSLSNLISSNIRLMLITVLIKRNLTESEPQRNPGFTIEFKVQVLQ